MVQQQTYFFGYKLLKHYYFFAHRTYEIVYSVVKDLVWSRCISSMYHSPIGWNHMPSTTVQPSWHTQFLASPSCIVLAI